MSSILRIDSSRANGAKSKGPATLAGKLVALANSAKSTGPLTPEGKLNSSQNAIRHGILAQSIVLDNESIDAFGHILQALQEELKPVSDMENRYIETMAFAEWRRLRLICLEKEQITEEIRRQQLADLSTLGNNDEEEIKVSPLRYIALAFRALSDESRAHELLNRAETRYDRQYERALKGFRAHRAEKRKDEKEARRARRTKVKT